MLRRKASFAQRLRFGLTVAYGIYSFLETKMRALPGL